MPDRKPLILLSRDPELHREVASWRLPGVDVFIHESPSEALAAVSGGRPVMLILDAGGFGRPRPIVRKFRELGGDADLVILGGREGIDAGPEPGGIGTTQALPADLPRGELRDVVERLLRLRRIRERSGIVGRSRAVSEMISLIAHAAPLDVNILIQGESGTGKELVARAIHEHSARRGGPFVSLNCGAMSEGVLESELFGHVRGAFTGAVGSHDGVFRRADGGTLFLDEVAEMPLGMQTRFLRALETGEFTPVGGRELLHSDIRLVAATLRDLALEVEEGRFRQDLYYRLRVIVIPTPPLRERRDDVPVLAETFLAQENARLGLSVRGIAREAMQLLQAHSWPGNVRELRNVISAAAVIKQRGLIEAEDLPPEVRGGRPAPVGGLPVPLGRDDERLERQLLTTLVLELREDVKQIKALLGGRAAGPGEGRIPHDGRIVETYGGEAGYSPVGAVEGGDLQTAERRLIEAALRATGGRRRQAAERLGISERTLYRKLKRYGLQ